MLGELWRGVRYGLGPALFVCAGLSVSTGAEDNPPTLNDSALASAVADSLRAPPGSGSARNTPEAVGASAAIVSGLPILPGPPLPLFPMRFLAPPSEPAGVAARSLARRVMHFQNFRAAIPGGEWRTSPAVPWSVRPAATCLRTLQREGVRVRPLERELTTPVPVPVVLEGPVGGIWYKPAQLDREIELSCEFAARLPALSRTLRHFGVTGVVVASSYRDHPLVSFHTFGLGLDIAVFVRGSESLVVSKHFELSPEALTCDATPQTEPGRALQDIACALADTGMFNSVLTPNYNAGHRDHFHLDVRPDDPRVFVR